MKGEGCLLDVKSSGEDVCGYEHARLALSELPHHPVSGSQIQVTMYAGALVPVLL